VVKPTPIAPRERVQTLDVLRGFAMLGVLLANLFVLYSYRFASSESPADDATADTIARWFMALFVHGRAQTLLTFLFGLGFALQLLRARERAYSVLPIYFRRLLALFVIGWLHVLLLSWVDVTWGYATTALLLIPFVACSNRVRLVAAAACTLIPAVVYTIPDVPETLHSILFNRPRDAYGPSSSLRRGVAIDSRSCTPMQRSRFCGRSEGRSRGTCRGCSVGFWSVS
jgi:uncharacterized membrane protein YeiB